MLKLLINKKNKLFSVYLALTLVPALAAMDHPAMLMPKRKLESTDAVLAKKSRNEVPKLVVLSTKALVEWLKKYDLNCIEVVEKSLKQLPDVHGCELIALYLQDLASQASLDSTGKMQTKLNNMRIKLAAYCVTKSSMLWNGSKGQGPVPLHFFDIKEAHLGVNGRQRLECPLSKMAIHILNCMLADKFFLDQAELQPLTLFCKAQCVGSLSDQGRKQYFFQDGITRIQRYLLSTMHIDRIIHAVKQLIAYDEQAALNFLELARNSRLFEVDCIEPLYQWASFFRRPRVQAWLQKMHQMRNNDAAKLEYKFHCSCPHPFHMTEHHERAIYLGKADELKSTRIQLVRNLGAFEHPAVRVFKEVNDTNHTPACCDALAIAAKMGYLKLARLCLDQEINVREMHIIEAAKFGQVEMLKLLLPILDYEEVISLLPCEHESESELYDVAQVEWQDQKWKYHKRNYYRITQMGHDEALLIILDKFDKTTFTEMFVQVIYSNNSSLIGKLLDRFSRLDFSDKKKAKIMRELLCTAVGHRDISVLRQFLMRGIALNGFGRGGNPLHYAVTRFLQYPKTNMLEVIQLLLEHGAYDEPDSSGNTVLAWLQQVKQNAGKIDLETPDNRTAETTSKLDHISKINALLTMLIESSKKPKNHLPREELYTTGLHHHFNQEADI